MKIIITDLTRFREGVDQVCIAGIDTENKDTCIRPIPYLKKSKIIELDMIPGAILEGEFSSKNSNPPHTEDNSWKNLKYAGPCTSDEFEEVLQNTAFTSLSEGFDNKIPDGEKVIPPNDPPNRSIVTLKIEPQQIEIVRDGWKKEKIRLHLQDNDRKNFRFLGITDLGFYKLALSKQNDTNYTDALNGFIRSQKKAYLRIGLGREYTSPDGRQGYWIQVNGIYTFPKFLTEVRTYQH